MCFAKTPKMPTVQEPVRPQETKQPEQGAYGSTSEARRRANAGSPAAAASTLLTGPSGIENKQLQLNKSTLLGM